jgi:membrane-associated protease RseP (regulator of RpoE activity)
VKYIVSNYDTMRYNRVAAGVNTAFEAEGVTSAAIDANIIKSVTVTKFMSDVGKWTPVLSIALSMSNLRNGMESISPADVIPLPLASVLIESEMKRIDEDMKSINMMAAAKVWSEMVYYANEYNSDGNISVIFVYSDKELHSTQGVIPYSIAFSNAREAERALGFVPSVVYFQFITENTSQIAISTDNKLEFP